MSFDLREQLRCKPNVNPAGAHPMIQSAIVTACHTIWLVAGKPTTITSMCDGIHHGGGGFSFHYVLMAVDLRSRHLTSAEKHAVVDKLQERLGDGWDVLLEFENGVNEHFHVEWDEGRHHWRDYLEELQQDFIAKLEGREP